MHALLGGHSRDLDCTCKRDWMGRVPCSKQDAHASLGRVLQRWRKIGWAWPGTLGPSFIKGIFQGSSFWDPDVTPYCEDPT
eukprot:1160382-Pelagomonas_calceolata.AAC.8